MLSKLKMAFFIRSASLFLFASLAVADTLPKHASICPAISALKKSPVSSMWYADGRKWRSDDPSLAEKVDRFLGAQWRGNNLGNIVCLYQPEDKGSFIIELRYSYLVNVPQGGVWSKDLGGYKNCRSQEQKDCYFVVPEKPRLLDIYKEADGFK